jgi:hypothetical protein
VDNRRQKAVLLPASYIGVQNTEFRLIQTNCKLRKLDKMFRLLCSLCAAAKKGRVDLLRLLLRPRRVTRCAQKLSSLCFRFGATREEAL